MQVKVQCQVHLSRTESLWFDWFIVSLKSIPVVDKVVPVSFVVTLFLSYRNKLYMSWSLSPFWLIRFYFLSISLLQFLLFLLLLSSPLLFLFVCCCLCYWVGLIVGSRSRLYTPMEIPIISKYLIRSHKPESGWLSFFAGLLNDLVSEVLAASVCVLTWIEFVCVSLRTHLPLITALGCAEPAWERNELRSVQCFDAFSPVSLEPHFPLYTVYSSTGDDCK